jgi:hypothetical protein
MQNKKRPAPRKNTLPPEDQDDVLSDALCALALELAEQEDAETEGDALRRKHSDFVRLVRKYVQQQKDELLYTAVMQARDEDVAAWRLLRDTVEDAAGTIHVRRDSAPDMEINAFAIPVFVHSTGGLVQDDEFQDDAAYDALLASFTQAGLEAPKARVVLVRHAYDLGEMSRIRYGHLNAMVREAASAMMDKKVTAAPALDRSIAGWPKNTFGPEDSAVELRFLLGFALKRADDPFYAAPKEEAAQDAYFAARMERYRQWTVDAAPLVARCLAGERAVQLNFLYQDLFYGALEQGRLEHAMLEMMAQLRAVLDSGDAPARVVIAPAEARGETVLRVVLYGADGNRLAACDKPVDPDCDVAMEVDDVADALSTLGIAAGAVELAAGYDNLGRPMDARPLAS